MPVLDTLCEALEKVRATAQAPQPPAFTLGHVILSLKYLDQAPHSRELLRERLGLGEGSVKTLIKHLKNEGLVNVSKSYGTIITPQGKEILQKIEQNIKIQQSKYFFDKEYVITVKDATPPTDLVEVYLLRDYFVEEGCRSVVIGGCLNGKPIFPGIQDEYTNSIRKYACPGEQAMRSLTFFCPEECFISCLSAIPRLILKHHCR